jgi:hypothetical protein
MKLSAALLFLAAATASALQAVTIPTIAGVLSIAASSGQIVRETHDLIRHPLKTLKHHGKQLKEAAKGKKP